MKTLAILFSGLILSALVFAQKPEGVVLKTTMAPVIDGLVDEVWAEANAYDITLPFFTELPTVTDNAFFPYWRAL